VSAFRVSLVAGPGEVLMTDPKPIPEMTRLRHELLRRADRGIGGEAEVAVLKERLEACTAERDRLATQLEAVRRSTTWRVGRVLVAPAALARRRRRR
jgi:hypothetical protein